MKTKTMAAALAAIASAFPAFADTHVTAAVAEDCAGMGAVTALDKTFADGATVTLKATPAKGYSFAGWYIGDTPAETRQDYRVAANTCTAEGDAMAFTARFVAIADDYIDFDFETDLMSFEAGEQIEDGYVLDVVSASFPAITFSGLPAGMKFDQKTLAIGGRPTKEGVYYVTATAKNASGYQYSQTIRCEIGYPEEPEETIFDAYPDFSGIEDLTVGEQAGDEADLDDAPLIGVYSAEDKEGVVSVSGLPAGLKLVSVTDPEDGFTYRYVTGTPTKAGVYTVSAKVSCENPDTERTVTGNSTAKIIVKSFPSVYIDAAAGEGGTVSGAGVYAAGATANIKATAAKGYVFAGWTTTADSDTYTEVPGEDWRNPAVKLFVGQDVDTVWYATFATSADDAEIEIASEDISSGETAEYDPLDDGEPFELYYSVESFSLPKVSVAGLPAGFEFTTKPEGGDFAITFDPATAKKTPAPGLYPVTISAKNTSGASATLAFNIKIANLTDDNLPEVPDELGVFDPNVEIDPIDVSGYAAFADGATLSVSGLPKGLVYNAKANAKTGAGAYTITGTPTAPGTYTVTFGAKVPAGAVTNAAGKVAVQFAAATATSTITINPFPETAVAMDDDAADAGCKVSGGGRYPAGTKITLKAVPAKGWVFAGWEGLEEEAAWYDIMNPSLAMVSSGDDTWISALFVPVSEDWLWVEEPADGDFAMQAGVAFTNATAVLDLIGSISRPTVTVSGLPAGLKFDAKTYLLSGTPAKAGVYYATIGAKNAGGYTHSRIVRIVVASADGEEPEEPEEADTAGIDLSDLDTVEIATGVYFTGDYFDSLLYFDVWEHPETGAEVSKIAVSGLPPGLSQASAVQDGVGAFMLYGTPSKPGRYTLTVTVTYADRKTAKTVKTFIVEDGGSYWLEAGSMDETLGTVAGSGVYAAGATVKLTAKAAAGAVFAGWYNEISLKEESGLPEGEGGGSAAEISPYSQLPEYDGIDFRTATVSFPFRPGEIDLDSGMWGDFVQKSEDAPIAIVFEEEDDDPVYEVESLDENWAVRFAVMSFSLPKVTATGLPKGLSLDAARGTISYTPAAKAMIVPGVYTVTLKAVNRSNAAATRAVTVIVPNKTCDAISTDPAIDAYPLVAGVDAGDAFDGIMLNYEGYTMTVAGLPSGLAWKNGSFTGVPKKAGTYTVTLTAKKTGEPVETATITVSVAALPAWAAGTFYGNAHRPAESGHDIDGPFTATISEDGAFTGKIQAYVGGATSPKAVTFKSAQPARLTETNGCEALVYENVPLTIPGTDVKNMPATFFVYPQEGAPGIGCIELVPPNADGELYDENTLKVSAYKSAWTGTQSFAPPAFAGNPSIADYSYRGAPLSGTVDIERIETVFGAKGDVTIKSFKPGAKTAFETCRAQLVVVQIHDGGCEGLVYISMPKSGIFLWHRFVFKLDAAGKVVPDGIQSPWDEQG